MSTALSCQVLVIFCSTLGQLYPPSLTGWQKHTNPIMVTKPHLELSFRVAQVAIDKMIIVLAFHLLKLVFIGYCIFPCKLDLASSDSLL